MDANFLAHYDIFDEAMISGFIRNGNSLSEMQQFSVCEGFTAALMHIDSPVRRWFALACLASQIFGVSSVSRAAAQDHSVCFDTQTSPSTRTAACTIIIDTSGSSTNIRLAAYLNRADSNYLAGKLDDAIEDYSTFISAEANNPTAFHGRGLAYLAEKQFLEAIADFSKAIGLNARYISAYNNRGMAYAKIKDYQKALADFDVALQLDPFYAVALYNRSLTYLDIAEYEFAIVDLKRAVEIQPRNPELYNELAWTYLKMGWPLQGIPYVNRSLALKPSANAYDTLGAIYEKLGKITQAIDNYGRALALDRSFSNSAEALRRLLANNADGAPGVGMSALVSELMQLVEKHGWEVDMDRMCALMKLSSRSNCKFKQIAVSTDAPNTIDSNGLNVPEDDDPQYLVIYHLGPLVGNFFVVSLNGTVRSAFFRAAGVDYTEVPVGEASHAFGEAIIFWVAHLETIKESNQAKGLLK